MAGNTVRTSRTQAERSAAMRRRLLDATTLCLSEVGYQATTTAEVQRRAGVSRGALLHHFASRTELMLAAVDHLTRQRLDEVIKLTRAKAPPGAGRIEWAIRVLWSSFDGPLFTAALELWMAARHDPDLLGPLIPQERILGHSIRASTAELFGPPFNSSPEFEKVTDLLGDAMRGAAARRVLRPDSSDERLIKTWVEIAEERLTR
ncbi:TetR/AcrR family transcriptional regulator [Amycolatopsis pigmentata]|uniref:TetR/AcrR family transcriptional regulator n=1 Tax=Amycolatopsis pigmentata TaxID=450801 RepID=A0ABW5G7S0_9PSEU